MKTIRIRSAAALAIGVAALGWNTLAGAQTVVVQPGQQPAPPPPPPQPSVIVTPGATEVQPPSSSVVVNGGMATAPAPETMARPITRPNRTLLMTGLVAFGAPYIASMGIAATSPHVGDSNLWVPALGPWLDLGERGGCPSGTGADCGNETGNKVLLVGDGILQTFGAFEIIGAFIWPETVGVTTVGSARGTSVSFTPSKVSRDGYGLSAVGQF